MKYKFTILLSIAIFFQSNRSMAQNYTFDDFVGTWHGYISSSNHGYNYETTIVIYDDGYYTESSGLLMPYYYPNNQACEYDASTNLFHWWFYDAIIHGQPWYTDIYHEVHYFTNNGFELHYQAYSDPYSNGSEQTINLVKVNQSPPPLEMVAEINGNEVLLGWENPSYIPDNVILEGYNIYYSYDSNDIDDFGLLEYVTTETYVDMRDLADGGHYYYVTAKYVTAKSETAQYFNVESDPSNIAYITVGYDQAPPPLEMVAEMNSNGVLLGWEYPSNIPYNNFFSKYKIYYAFDSGDFRLLEYVTTETYVDIRDLADGKHYYYVTATYFTPPYAFVESDPSNIANITIVNNSISYINPIDIQLYPNPASNYIQIQSKKSIQNIEVYHITGQMVHIDWSESNQKTIDVSHLNSGIYILKLTCNDGYIVNQISIK